MSEEQNKQRQACVVIYSDGSVTYAAGITTDVAMTLLHKAYLYEEERFRTFCRRSIERGNADAE